MIRSQTLRWTPARSVAIVTLLGGCASQMYRIAYPTLSDGKYDSEFPYQGCSRELGQIAETVHVVNTITTYDHFVFDPQSGIRLQDLTGDVLDKKPTAKSSFTRTASGTTTVIYFSGRHMAALTCAHVVEMPDRVITYHADKNGQPTPYVQSVALRRAQAHYIADLPERGDVDVVAADEEADIALVGKVFQGPPERAIAVLRYRLGRARELEWGSFVYLFGCPMAQKMVTKAIVSGPNDDPRGSFLLDATFNRGFSGGIVLAVRDGVPNFEMVGMVGSVPADNDYVLAPPPNPASQEYDTVAPYKGDVYVDKKVNIKYGVAKAIPAEALVKFYEANREKLEKKGFHLESFFVPK